MNPSSFASVTADEDALLTVKDVTALTTLHRVTLWRMVKEGDFPKPVDLRTPRIAWRRSDVQRWIATRPRR